MSETISANTTISQYRIVSKIGEGGMGEVYRARDTKLGRDVAIKGLPASLSENTDRLNRFEQEAQPQARLIIRTFWSSFTSALIKARRTLSRSLR